MTSTQALTPRYGNLIAAIAAVACCDIAIGLTLQLVPLLMERQGLPAWLIGLNAAMGPIGILMAGPFLPRIIDNIGTRKAAYIAIALMMASLLAMPLAPSIWWWFPLRFIFGLCTGVLFTVSEAWVLTFASDHNRGRIMGFYTSVLAVTFSVGPLMLPWTGIEGWWPWAIGLACISLSALPLLFVRVDGDTFRQKEGHSGFFGFIRKAPLLLFAVCATTLFDSVLISFFTIYGLRSGLDLETASRILGIGIIGNVVMFYPIGWLADHWSRRGVMFITAGLTIVLSLALILIIGHWIVWLAIILLTASAFGVYVVALATMGDNFKGADVMAGSAAFAAMWGIGGLAGPPIAGAAIDLFGINAMPVTLAAFYVILLTGLGLTGGRLIRGGAHG